MSTFKFTDPETGKTFEVKAPAGYTEAQARAVFDKQLDSGALVGLKPGDVVSAAKQAAAGLSSALSQVGQAAAGIAGTVTGALGGAINKVTGAASSLSNSLSGALGAAKSLASQTISGITGAVKNLVPSNGINVGDFAKQASALVPIKGLSTADVTATLAAASKLVSQPASTMTNSLGVGKFGLDAKQLESAGYIKPGTVAKFLPGGTSNTLTSVLASPAVWTGKDNIKNVSSLLSSVPGQDRIQQGLMSSGLNAVGQLGIPVDKLDVKSLAGTALNAAKSPEAALNWAKGALPAGAQTAFNDVARNAGFATDLANFKIDDAMKGIEESLPASDTVNRETLNAASKRIVGNKKIPAVDYTSSDGSGITATNFAETYQDIGIKFDTIKRSWQYDIKQATDIAQYPALIRKLDQYISDLNTVDSQALSLIRYTIEIEKQINQTPPQKAALEKLRQDVASVIAAIDRAIAQKKLEVESSTA